MNAPDFETQPTPEKENQPKIEHVDVTMLNTHFGEALSNEETLEQLLPSQTDLSIVGFSEVTPGVRKKVVEAIEKQGYRCVIPHGEGRNIDIMWAVSPDLELRHSIAHRFEGRVASRPGKLHKRDAGTLVIEVVTPNGRVLRLSSERFAPPLRGERARRAHLLGMAAVLDELDANDAVVDIDISGGDHNKANGPTEAEKEMWEKRGYAPVVPEGTPTYNPAAAGRMARAALRAARAVGRVPTMEFDKMYARPGGGRELVHLNPDDPGDTLASNQVGFTTAETEWVGGSDHAAIKMRVSLPPKGRE